MKEQAKIFAKVNFWSKFSRYFAVITSIVILLVVGQVSIFQGNVFNGLDIAHAEVNGLGVQFESSNGSNWIATIFNDAGSGFDPGTVESQFGAYHCKTAGDFSCAPDIAGDVVSTLKFENILLPVPDKGTSTQVAFDVSQVNCGRVQVDIGLSGGRGILGGKNHNFGVNCPDAPGGGPTESPAPSPSQGGQACTPGEWSGATCARCNASGTGMEADGSDWGDFSSNASGWCGCAQQFAQSTQGKVFDSNNFPQCFGAQPSPSVCVDPGVPQNLKVDGQASGTTFPTDKRIFNLTWDGVSGATAYNVRLDDPRTPANPDIVQDNVQGTSLQVTLQDPGVTYFWWVHSVNTCGGSAANNANFSIAGSGGVPSPVPSSPASCDQFVTNNVCGQPAYDTCSPACTADGKAIYNCVASQNANCKGTLMCEPENARCQTSPAPSPASCVDFVTDTTCNQPSYDTCSPACTADGKAIYNCVASQNANCKGTLFCDPENARCQASPAPSSVPSASPSPIASCPVPMSPGNLKTNGQVDEANFPSTQTNFILSWDKVEGATSYTVKIDDTSTSTNPDITQDNVQGTSLQVEIKNPGRYSWSVKANNSCGASGPGGIDFIINAPGVSPSPSPVVSPSPSASPAVGAGAGATANANATGGNVTVNLSQQGAQVAGVTAKMTELPRTGLPIAAWAAAAFLPLGFKLRRFAKGINETQALNDKPHYISQKRILRK